MRDPQGVTLGRGVANQYVGEACSNRRVGEIRQSGFGSGQPLVHAVEEPNADVRVGEDVYGWMTAVVRRLQPSAS
jgi:hypothetical protein